MRRCCQIIDRRTRPIQGDILVVAGVVPCCELHGCRAPNCTAPTSLFFVVMEGRSRRYHPSPYRRPKGDSSEDSGLLSTCLQALNENAATNPGVGKTYAVICGVMARLGMTLPAANNANPVGECSTGHYASCTRAETDGRTARRTYPQGRRYQCSDQVGFCCENACVSTELIFWP
jgi:hypothetical protein